MSATRRIQMRWIAWVFSMGVFARVEAAEACSCTQRSFAEHTKAANQILLARAEKPVKSGAALKQAFAVLATLKGSATTRFVLDRPVTPPCATSYVDGELAILFATGSDLSPCAGNIPIAEQLRSFGDILSAAGVKTMPAKLDVVSTALGSALARYFHQRPRIGVVYGELAGTTTKLGSTTLAFAKTGGAAEITLKQAVVVGTVAFVEGVYGDEGVIFRVLLASARSSWSVVASSVVER